MLYFGYENSEIRFYYTTSKPLMTLEANEAKELCGRLNELIPFIGMIYIQKDPMFAATPDLLAACKLLANFSRPSKRDWENGACCDEFDIAREAAIAAIAKAEKPKG